MLAFNDNVVDDPGYAVVCSDESGNNTQLPGPPGTAFCVKNFQV